LIAERGIKKIDDFIAPVVLTPDRDVVYVGNMTLLKGIPLYFFERERSSPENIFEQPDVPEIFHGKWLIDKRDERDNFFPFEIEYNFNSINRNSISFYNLSSGSHDPIKIRGIPDKSGKMRNIALIYFDGLEYNKNGMTRGTTNRHFPTTLILSLKNEKIVISNQHGSREYTKQE
jgi:hypothetical protein